MLFPSSPKPEAINEAELVQTETELSERAITIQEEETTKAETEQITELAETTPITEATIEEQITDPPTEPTTAPRQNRRLCHQQKLQLLLRQNCPLNLFVSRLKPLSAKNRSMF